MYDMIIKGGRLLSKSDGLDVIGDIAVKNGKIAAIGGTLESGPDTVVIDAKDCYVSPGFIDLHIHGYAYNTDYGTFPDKVGVLTGVTTVVDQGSCGALTFPGFKHYMIETSKSRVLSFINIGAVGTIKGSMLPPLHGPQSVDVRVTIETIEENRDIIRGIKTHAEMGGYSRWGLEVLRLAKKASRATKVPCYVHTGKLFTFDEDRIPNPDEVLPEAVQLLDSGDILTHCFTANEGGILARNGKVHPEIIEALERGIVLDVGYGEHFSFEIADKVLDQGIVPTVLSSDVHAPFNKPHSLEVSYGLNKAMSRMLALGFDLPTVIDMVTAKPASLIGLSDEIGHLETGKEADITVFAIESGRFEYKDPWGTSRMGDKKLKAKYCIKSGEAIELAEDEESNLVEFAG
ncbi:amidohydrolase/deacetylase family metallohydrolase [Paenibacillus beijingensis]|uniref:Dihydroorotase n=1 Tax=Paenibacillus beijingensis TaxID=1126833 RepID=A0A0D5NDM2_9BACL|nr:amidohydrolase/deacetylase family metallohydrolase [Paenibacillus beijingensis]AJY73494.1 dihydroorotase [Paenibacillus beijingensis]